MVQDALSKSTRESGSSRSRQLSTLQYLKLKNCDVTPGIAKAILRTMDGYGPTCWASLATIATDSGFSKASVTRAIKWLYANGYVAGNEPNPPQYLPDGRRRPTGYTVTYRINWDHPDLSGPNDEAAEDTTPVTVTPQGDDLTVITQTTPVITQTTPVITQTTPVITQTTYSGYTPEKKTKKKPERGARAKPSIDLVKEYWKAESLKGNPEKFFHHYEANGWTRGKNPIENWRAVAELWSVNEQEFASAKTEKEDWKNNLRKPPEPLIRRPTSIPGLKENLRTQGCKP